MAVPDFMPEEDATEKDSERAKRKLWPFMAFLVFFYAGLAVGRFFLAEAIWAIPDKRVGLCLGHALNVALLILPVVVYILVFERTNPLTYLRLTTLPKGRRLLMSLAFLLSFVVLGAAAAHLQGGSVRNVLSIPTVAVLLILRGSFLTALLEEPAFRGLIFRKLRENWGFQKANAATALLFMGIHVLGGAYTPGECVEICIMGWIYGLGMEVSGTLWLPILLHTLNNTGTIVFLQP